jgi:hypothetical protein
MKNSLVGREKFRSCDGLKRQFNEPVGQMAG